MTTRDNRRVLDKRPSLEALSKYVWRDRVPRHALHDLRRAAPVLLEIAAAANKWLASDDDDRASELEALIIALDKIRR